MLEISKPFLPLSCQSDGAATKNTYDMKQINIIIEIPLSDVRSENYHKNEKKCINGIEPCLVCGKPIKDINKAKHVQLLTNGNIVSTDQEFDNTQGFFPVGSDCAKKLIVSFAN